MAAAPVAETEAPPPAAPVEDEPVTFSFGGAKIAMKEPGKPDKVKPPKRASGMNSTVSAILSFAVIALVLFLAFYLITK